MFDYPKRRGVGAVFNLPFRTRLALVMFLIMALTSAVLMWTYVQQSRRFQAYTTGLVSDLLAISEIAHEKLPPNVDRTTALTRYKQLLADQGLSKIDVASPSGEVVASTNPAQVGKKIKIPAKRRAPAKPEPINISAEFRDIDIDANVEQRPLNVQFPIVQGEKVIGYVQLRGLSDEFAQLMKQTYLARLMWILATMLAGLFAVVYLAFRFTKPVDMLVTGAQQVAQGNLYVALPSTGSDEMGRLAQTFNHMVERLRDNRELQERLNQAEKSSLVGRFAASVAHEVRNSLNYINLSIDQVRVRYARAEPRGDERAGRELERNLCNMKEEVSRLNRLVNDFLAAGRQTSPQLAPCDLPAMLQDTVTLVEKQAHTQAIRIDMEVAPDVGELQADAGQLKTCFLNILTNAVQAMPLGGAIHIHAARIASDANGHPGLVEIRFADTGPGIPPADREKVFAPYFSTKTTGFGLGLAITRKVVEDHGGRIQVESAEPSGTVMVLQLPLRHPVPRPAMAAAQ
jgi:signal transduction histidine kinase